MNNVNIIGRLTRDPEHVTTNGGTDICNLRIAVDKRGEGAVFVDVKTFGRQAQTARQYLAKGRQVGIEGRLELDEWTTDSGERRSRLYVIAGNVQFLGAKPQGEPASDSQAPAPVQAVPEQGPQQHTAA